VPHRQRPSILLRPDLDKRTGLGHLARCLALAGALRRGGGDPYLVIDAASVPLVQTSEIPVLKAEAPGSGDPLGLALVDLTDSAVVVDSYRLDAPSLQALRSKTALLVVLDDLAECYGPADLVVNGAAHAEQLSYDPAVAGEVLAGSRYMLLRHEFSQAKPRRLADRPRDVLLSTGGGDPMGLMELLIYLTHRALGGDATLHVVVGPNFPTEWSAPGSAEQWRELGVRLHIHPRDLHPLMAEMDLAVTAAGLVLYELAAVQVPTVAFSIAANQRPQLRVLAERGALRSAGDASETGFAERLERLIREVAYSVEGRVGLAERARTVVDGRGAERVAIRILEKMASRR
jgi:UDP-2,4-diacetamido-2,4,6-trideoxy-beta-L-altropyranose hydrolase